MHAPSPTRVMALWAFGFLSHGSGLSDSRGRLGGVGSLDLSFRSDACADRSGSFALVGGKAP